MGSMNPKTILSKTTSVVASLVLAIGGSLIATQPASATDMSSASWAQNPAASSNQLAISIGSCTINGFANPTPTPQTTDFSVTVNSSPRTVSNVLLGSNISLVLSSALSGSDIVVVTYTKSATSANQIPCTTTGNYVGSFSGLSYTVATPTYTVTLDANGGNSGSTNFVTQASAGASVTLPTTTGAPTKSGCTLRGWAVNTTNATNAILVSNTYTPSSSLTLYASWNCSGGGGGGTCVINGVTQTMITSIVANTPTLVSSGSYHLDWNGDATLNSCSLPLNANYGILYVLNGAAIGSAIFNQNVVSINMSSSPTTYTSLLSRPQFTGVTVNDGDVLKIRYFFGGAQAPTIIDTPSFEVTMTLYPGGVVTGGSQSTAQVTRTVERYVPPTPAFQAPILNSLAPKLTSGFSSNGGKLVLKDVKPTDITSVTLNGKPVTIVESKSGSALKIPAGSAAGDLKFTMADGTVIDVPNAVKITQSQVDPRLVDLNNLPTFKAGSVAVPKTITAALNKNKAIILDSVNAKCVGYATSNTASARATALTRASNVCGVITDINESIDPIIKVVVNKVVAKKSPVKYQTW